jgi:peptidoglycan/LPS O-acetylase OafA/YrhL
MTNRYPAPGHEEPTNGQGAGATPRWRDRMKRRASRVVPALAVAFVASLFVAGFAFAGARPAHAFACYLPRTGAVRIVQPARGTASAACPQGERLISWSTRSHWRPWTLRASGAGVQLRRAADTEESIR